MSKLMVEQLERHIKTHTARSADDSAAVNMLKHLFSTGGKINDDFHGKDTWPNTDGVFEFVPDTDVSRRPKQNFVVQIKGTSTAEITKDNIVKYRLKNLAFPAYVAKEVTLDPCILFVVLNPGKRGQERVFWKYISAKFIASIDFTNDSATLEFTPDEEIKDTDESVQEFVEKLDYISDTHSYMKQLESREYTKEDVLKLILGRCKDISEEIENGMLLNYSRDKISRKILTQLGDLCNGALLLNGLTYYDTISLRTAWELAMTNIETRFLATFLQGLRYIGLRVPEEGQYERLILKYYGFLWKIRKYVYETQKLTVLSNLEKLLPRTNEEDEEYNKLLAASIDKVAGIYDRIGKNRYYIRKKVPFYVGTQRYFEITLQLADKYATKYNRLTVYSKIDISSDYSIQVGCIDTEILLWDKPSKIKVVTSWRVSIEPAALNKLSKLVRVNKTLSSIYKEYDRLMYFLTRTGMSLLDIIDMQSDRYNSIVKNIYENAGTNNFKDVLMALRKNFNAESRELGKNTVRYVLLKLREELLEELLPADDDEALKSDLVYLSKRCYAFEQNPILYNLPGNKTNGKTISTDVLRASGTKDKLKYIPYIRMKHLIDATGEIYYPADEIECKETNQTIDEYNSVLSSWDELQGRQLKEENGYVYLEEYVKNTVFILQNLLDVSASGNDGQELLNQNYVERIDITTIDDTKLSVLKNIFVDSKIMTIYGAAGTGKTTLMKHISDLMDGRRMLYLSKTHTALENMIRTIKPRRDICKYMVIDQFINSGMSANYDVIFIDECSTIDNRSMVQLLKKLDKDSLLVFAGDIYQIESIEFGNWFFYAKEILPEKSVAELNSTWRTQQQNIKELWEAVRFLHPLITEMLVINGAFSENIGKNLFEKTDEDEVVLCLNYDGKFGLNSINNYFQDANPSTEVFYWSEWKYKVGDKILFNDNKRFPMLYNNLKGTIIDIQSENENHMSFTIDVPIVLTAIDCRGYDLERISGTEKSTRIRFSVYEFDEGNAEEGYEDAKMKSIVPFQLAYAVSIHKAQGLEYNSVKVVIPNSNSEKISHGIFYTAITRTKEKLKIFWSSDTMNQVISNFREENNNRLSLNIIKSKLFSIESEI